MFYIVKNSLFHLASLESNMGKEPRQERRNSGVKDITTSTTSSSSTSSAASARQHNDGGTENNSNRAQHPLFRRVGNIFIVIVVFLYAISSAYRIRLFAIQEFGLILHKNDPYFNFRAAEVSNSLTRGRKQHCCSTIQYFKNSHLLFP